MPPLRVSPRIVPIDINGGIVHGKLRSLKIPAANSRFKKFGPLRVRMALVRRLSGVVVFGTYSYCGQKLGILRDRYFNRIDIIGWQSSPLPVLVEKLSFLHLDWRTIRFGSLRNRTLDKRQANQPIA